MNGSLGAPSGSSRRTERLNAVAEAALPEFRIPAAWAPEWRRRYSGTRAVHGEWRPETPATKLGASLALHTARVRMISWKCGPVSWYWAKA